MDAVTISSRRVEIRSATEPRNVPVSKAGAELLPAPESPVNYDSAELLLQLSNILIEKRDLQVVSAGEAITRTKSLKDEQLKQAEEACKRAQASEGSGGLFSGLSTAFEAFTVDLVGLDTITDPSKALSESYDKASDATLDNPMFWKELESGAMEIARWGAVAGSVALAVVSCGSAAPVAALAITGAVLSCAGAANSSFGVLKSLGTSDEVSMWVGVGLSVGGAICSGGASLAGTPALAAGGVKAAAQVGGTTANVAGGSAMVVGGGAHVKVAGYEHDGAIARIDLKETEVRQKHFDALLDATLEHMKSLCDATERATALVQETMNQHLSARLHIVGMVA